jgi:uncharacterized protein YggL (DUF469 family)
MAHHTGTGVSRELQQCIAECLACYQACHATVRHCLELGGSHAEAEHITLLLDCAQVCQTSAELMLHGSDMHRQACVLCAEFCRSCEESCRALAHDDEMMRYCADACQSCAASCDRMAIA